MYSLPSSERHIMLPVLQLSSSMQLTLNSYLQKRQEKYLILQNVLDRRNCIPVIDSELNESNWKLILTLLGTVV
jgi:hypothetical protein